MSIVSGKITGFTASAPQNNRRQTDPFKAHNPPKKSDVVITLDELDRIRSQVGPRVTHDKEQYDKMRITERRTLQDISKSRVQNWPNTLEAQRNKREQERINKLEQEEIKRREVDAIEEEYQERLRRDQILRANQILHDDQDQVKALKSKMLMCDVAYEQKAQQELHKRKQVINNDIKKHWEEVEVQKMRDYDEKMRAKLEEEYARKMENAQEISTQLENFKLNYIKQMKDEILEGELIKRQTEEDLEREKLKELAKIHRQKEMKQQLVEANKDQIELRKLEQLREEQENLKIEEHARKRLEMENMKKDREQGRFRAKQDERQRLIDRQIQELWAKKSNQEQVLNKQVAEAENKANTLFEDQQRRRLEMQQAIDRSRQIQVMRRQKEKQAGKQEEKEFSQFWNTRNEELAMAEEQEREEDRHRQIEIAEFRKQQVNNKNQAQIKNFMDDHESALRANAMQDQQQKNFYSYAEKCLKDWEASGKNVKPLVLELKNYKKRVV